MGGFYQGVAVAAGDVGVVLVGVDIEEIGAGVGGHGWALDDGQDG